MKSEAAKKNELTHRDFSQLDPRKQLDYLKQLAEVRKQKQANYAVVEQVDSEHIRKKMTSSTAKTRQQEKQGQQEKLRVASYTLGCKVNQYESDAILQGFLRKGYSLATFEEEADVYILNTCSVTGEAGRKSGQMLRKARKKNPKAILVAMGCHIQLGGFGEVADILVGTQGKSKIFQAVESFLKAWQDAGYEDSRRPPLMDLTSPMALSSVPEYEELGIVDQQSDTRAYVKVQDGCNNFCSFCTIPFARGRVRSRKPQYVIEEVQSLVSQGYREIVLTGIHVCSYGEDFPDAVAEKKGTAWALMDLIDSLQIVEGLERIRLGSLEPLSISKEFIDRAVKNPLLCPHYHLSLQSGCTATLKRMRRRYTAEQFAEVVENLRQAYGERLGLTTDVIVGFPGETEEEFAASLKFCEEMNFSRMHIFRYSEREGTAAVRYPNKVPAELAMQRAKVLNQLNQNLQKKRAESRIGLEETLILEQKNRDGFWEGYTPSYDSVTIFPLAEFEAPYEPGSPYAQLERGMAVKCKIFGQAHGLLHAALLEIL